MRKRNERHVNRNMRNLAKILSLARIDIGESQFYGCKFEFEPLLQQSLRDQTLTAKYCLCPHLASDQPYKKAGYLQDCRADLSTNVGHSGRNWSSEIVDAARMRILNEKTDGVDLILIVNPWEPLLSCAENRPETKLVRRCQLRQCSTRRG